MHVMSIFGGTPVTLTAAGRRGNHPAARAVAVRRAAPGDRGRQAHAAARRRGAQHGGRQRRDARAALECGGRSRAAAGNPWSARGSPRTGQRRCAARGPRAAARNLLSRAQARRAAFRRGRLGGAGGHHHRHHRGDEADEHRARRGSGAPSSRSWRRMARWWNTARRCCAIARGPTVTIRRILIANRGEIAVRIIRTCRALGIETVLAVSEADRDSAARAPGGSHRLHRPRTRRGQLPEGRDDRAGSARASGRDAIHPGYGFLSERAALAQPVRGARHHLHRPHRRSRSTRWATSCAARAAAEAAGVPVVPGGAVASAEEAQQLAQTHRRAAAGQGGRRRRRTRHEARASELGRSCRGPGAGRRGGGRGVRRCARVPGALRRARHGTSRCRCWATAQGASSISASATARCSAATRS